MSYYMKNGYEMRAISSNALRAVLSFKESEEKYEK